MNKMIIKKKKVVSIKETTYPNIKQGKLPIFELYMGKWIKKILFILIINI